MPVISKIRFTNVIYEGGNKRYNDELFVFDGHNGAILLENGGGKTVFIQTALQAVLPHKDLAGRRIKETLSLSGTPAHIAIEWILRDSPRRYALTAVTLFMHNNELDSFRYVYEYEEGSPYAIEELPFAKEGVQGKKRPADKGEMQEYYAQMSARHLNAHTFDTIKGYHAYLEESFQLIPTEWNKIATINGAEGGVEIYFDDCKTTDQLVSQLLIPTVEEAINGNNGDAFAEIFDKQREQFKQSKQLRMQIQESKLLETQVQQYTQVYANYHEAKSELEREKEWTRALFQHVRDERVQTQLEVDNLGKQLTENERQLHVIQRKKKSRDISAQEAVVSQCAEDWRMEKERLEELEQQHERAEHSQYTLEYAKYKAQKQEAEEKQELALDRIAKLDQEQDIAEMKDDFERTNREIRGYYANAEKSLQQEERVIRSQLDSIQQQKKAKLAEIQTERKSLEGNEREQAVYQERGEQASRNMERIAGNILDNPREEVEELIHVWQEEMSKNQQNQRLYQQYLSECQEHKRKLEEKLGETRQSLQTAQDQANLWNLRCSEAEKQHQTVLNGILSSFPRYGYLESLYARQETLTQTVLDKVLQLDREKEEVLLQERMATRLSDEYYDTPFYMADPELFKLVEKWKGAFHYLETGTQFLQDLQQQKEFSLEILHARFPYWAASLITTEQEVESVENRLQKHADILRNPVFILTIQEARAWLETTEAYPFACREIIPSHWQENLVQDRFAKWKQELEEKAAQVTSLRKNKEAEYQQLLQQKNQLLQFYADYPQDLYAEWKRQRDEYREQASQLQSEIARYAEQIQKEEKDWRHYQEKLSEEMGREQYLSFRLQQAQDYMLEKKGWEEAKKKEGELLRESTVIQQRLRALERALQTVESHELELEAERKEKEYGLVSLRGEWLYEQVRDYQPLSPQYSIERLRAQRNELEKSLRQQQASRAQLEEEAQRLRKESESSERQMALVLAKISHPLDVTYVFPVDGDAQLERLVNKVVDLKKATNAQRSNAEELYNRLARQTERLAAMNEHFQKEYQDEQLDSFVGDLTEALQMLEQEETEIEGRRSFLQEQEGTRRKTIKELDDVIRELEIKNGTYGFAESNVADVAVREDEILTFPYQRTDTVRKRLHSLAQKQDMEVKELKKVTAEQERFKRFCEDNIRNIKLRDTAKAGIQNKQNYSEVREWADSLSKTIANSIRVLEDNLQGRDKELQDFITIVHTHLQRIAAELKTIPKKTSVKVEGGRREVYHFHVPEWKEEMGKQLLRQQVDWMLSRLDGDEFKDPEGKEDLGKMKKFIYTQLQSKSLLGIVMGNDSIRVKCRKVSKDGQVSGALSSWEESNKWSGGEKWSKNMTLFLGILNYLAEKRQPIAQSGKRYRTVIVDNPFGKASSEHVLDPVFFIADELGFQIIALTAHAEGKFIRDYFPVVYSCRLRESASGDALILTKEREIKQAYFRDHAPNSLLRLSEHEQLSLFS
ncbi:hypothetical protein EDM59_20440 [Brevibacillus nitrificans]|uniref:Chromosome segregation ATPase n=2 Tax=Brevibacillus nitrificans TaxID=651560 RepID=A0A3M8D5N3_9BACL|nr:hypothetical protein EDM59_20440 [Brevibacillus nitrificans]